MVKMLIVALALLVSVAASGCSGGSSGGAIPPAAPAVAANSGQQPVAQVRSSQDFIGGGDTPLGFAARVAKPIVGATPAPSGTATPAPCYYCW